MPRADANRMQTSALKTVRIAAAETIEFREDIDAALIGAIKRLRPTRAVNRLIEICC